MKRHSRISWLIFAALMAFVYLVGFITFGQPINWKTILWAAAFGTAFGALRWLRISWRHKKELGNHESWQEEIDSKIEMLHAADPTKS